MMVEKQVFIDFGSGPKMDKCIRYHLKNFYVIAVNNFKKDLFENAEESITLDYYETICDELNFFDLSDLSYSCDYKADVWNCSAVLEHVEENKIENFLTNIKNNIKDNSEGYISIDLTDHNGGFDHYNDLTKYDFIKNTLKEKDWNYIIKEHFDIRKYYVQRTSTLPSTLFYYGIKKK